MYILYSTHLRSIIIDKKQAEFDPFIFDDDVEEKVEAITNSLNPNQNRAVNQVWTDRPLFRYLFFGVFLFSLLLEISKYCSRLLTLFMCYTQIE